MSDQSRPGCSKISPEKILLLAYQELEDEDAARHISECEHCRRYIEELRKVGDLADRAGMVTAGDEVIERIRARARAAGAEPEPRRLQWRRPLLAAAAVVVLAVGVGLYIWTDLAGREVPQYVTGVRGDIAELERMVADNEQSLRIYSTESADSDYSYPDYGDSGYTDYPVESGEEFQDMEVALLELEQGMGLSSDWNSGYVGSGGEEVEGYDDGYGYEEEDYMVIPRLPAWITGSSL